MAIIEIEYYMTTGTEDVKPIELKDPNDVGVPIELTDSNESIQYDNPYSWVRKEIDSFMSLESNWDGYGGIPVLETVGEKAKQFISLLNDYYIDRIADIFPNPHGTITLEWENENSEKLSLELGESNYSFFVHYINDKPKLISGEGIPDIKLLTSLLDQLLSKEIPQFLL